MKLDERIPEPQLMDHHDQVKAYAEADFSQPHEMFVDLLEERFGSDHRGTFLDLGCGPCDVTTRFAKRFPSVTIHAVDGSAPMLEQARVTIAKMGLRNRIELFRAMVPLSANVLPKARYDGVIVNSLLHHLPGQDMLWNTIERYVKPSGTIFIMDLIRPEDSAEAKRIVEKYSGQEPEILKKDFYNSLLAAYRVDEVRDFLKNTSLSHLTVEKVTDRHLVVWGKR